MSMECPKCGSRDTRRSLSNGLLDGFWQALRFTAFRCRSCRARFFRRRPEENVHLKERTAD